MISGIALTENKSTSTTEVIRNINWTLLFFHPKDLNFIENIRKSDIIR